MYILYSGSDEASSCPSELRMLPREGATLTLSSLLRSATCSQKSRSTVIVCPAR